MKLMLERQCFVGEVAVPGDPAERPGLGASDWSIHSGYTTECPSLPIWLLHFI